MILPWGRRKMECVFLVENKDISMLFETDVVTDAEEDLGCVLAKRPRNYSLTDE